MMQCLYSIAYSLPYMYTYILSGKKEVCFDKPCIEYIPEYCNIMFRDFQFLIGYHEGKEDIFTSEYNSLFKSIFKSNPCEYSKLSDIPDCSTFMGGIFTSGLHTTAIRQIDMMFSIYNDFTNKELDTSLIKKYALDIRLTYIQIIYLQFLNPALTLMIDELMSNRDEDIKKVVSLNVALFLMIMSFIIGVTLCWTMWLMKLVYNNIHETWLFILNLPDDIILKNGSIFKFLYKKEEKGD